MYEKVSIDNLITCNPDSLPRFFIKLQSKILLITTKETDDI